MFRGLNIISFSEKFSTNEKCFEYLADIKWENGYRCSSCNHDRYFAGKQPKSRCCTKCHYDESPTAHTLFHNVKFSLKKAFYIIFLVVTTKKGISSHELSRKLEMRQKTCWLFKRKVMEAMKSDNDKFLKGQIEVDEFFIGGPQENKKGRSEGKKRQVVLAIQVDKFGIHSSRAQVIPSAESIELEAFFNKSIDPDSSIRTDGWSGYLPLKNSYKGLAPEKSLKKGQSFPLMHRQIMMIKAWLRGIHHQCKHLQAYLDEYNYRFNRLKHMNTIFHNLIEKMMEHPPTIYQKLKVT
jgi:transposase-like protein